MATATDRLECDLSLVVYWDCVVMPLVKRLQQSRRADEKGANLVEYALLVAAVAIVCVGGVFAIGQAVAPKLSSAGSAF